MAMIEISREAAKLGHLPPVCIRCGQPARLYQPTKLYWRPWWVSVLFYPSALVYFIPYLILDCLFAQRIVLRAPVCSWHQFHWRWRVLVLFALFSLSVLSFVGGAILLIDLAEKLDRSRNVRHVTELAGILMMWLSFACILATLVALPVLKYTGIYVKRLTKETIILNRVAPRFAAVFWEETMQGAPTSGAGSEGISSTGVENVQARLRGR